MSLAQWQRLCGIRQTRLERAEREVAAAREEVQRRAQVLEAARAQWQAECDTRLRLAAAWRQARVSGVRFERDDQHAQDAAMERAAQRIQAAQQRQQQRQGELAQAERALQAARQRLAEARADQGRAEKARDQVGDALRLRREARDEADTEELALLARTSAAAAGGTHG